MKNGGHCTTEEKGVYSFPFIQISTCDVPVANKQLSICCFVENLPAGAPIVFSKNSIHVAILSQSCNVWYPVDKEASTFIRSCSMKGNVSMYSIMFPRLNFSSDDGYDAWSCGFYGFQVDMKITVLDGHNYTKLSPGSDAMLQYIINDATLPARSVRLYNLQQNHTLLEVDSNDRVIFKDDRVDLVGNVALKNISVKIHNISTEDNGTYICQYTNDLDPSSSKWLQGITILVLGKPRKSTVNSISVGKKVDGVISGTLTCTAESGYAAPLFYIPKLNTGWIFPAPDAWPPGTSGYTLLSNDSTAYIMGINCTSTSRLPVYCFVENDVGRSEFSEEFYPDTMCANGTEADIPDYGYMVNIVFGTVNTILTSIFFFICCLWQKKRRQCCIRCWRRILCCKLHGEVEQGDVAQATGNTAVGSMQNIQQQQQQQQRRGVGGQSNVSINVLSDERSPPLGVSNRQPRSVSGIETWGANGGTMTNQTFRRSSVGVETLIQRHHNNLRGRRTLTINRHRLVDDVLEVYQDEHLAFSSLIVRMNGEEGLDSGGVTADMYTDFWNRVQDLFFIGCERVVPELPAHRFDERPKFRILGRILSHSVAVMKTFPIPIMCKSTIIAMIYDTTEVAAGTLLEDFLYFLDDHERALVRFALNEYRELTTDQVDELSAIFQRFNYGARPSEERFRDHVTELARDVMCIRPRTLLELMRSGIPQSHFEHFWSQLHLTELDAYFKTLRLTAEKVIAYLNISDRGMTRRQAMVLQFLKDLLKEMTELELQTFLHFTTGKKSIPRQRITIQFTTETGLRRLPKAHTCSNVLELPETYEDYDTFRSEFKHLLASDVAMTMTMA